MLLYPKTAVLNASWQVLVASLHQLSTPILCLVCNVGALLGMLFFMKEGFYEHENNGLGFNIISMESNSTAVQLFRMRFVLFYDLRFSYNCSYTSDVYDIIGEKACHFSLSFFTWAINDFADVHIGQQNSVINDIIPFVFSSTGYFYIQ